LFLQLSTAASLAAAAVFGAPRRRRDLLRGSDTSHSSRAVPSSSRSRSCSGC